MRARMPSSMSSFVRAPKVRVGLKAATRASFSAR